MYIVETLSELKELRDFIEGKNSYWFPMWVDFDLHPLNTELSFIFIQCDGSDYILPHKHVDTLRIDLEGISDVLLTKGDKWVFQTKKFLNTLKIPNLELYDIDTAWFLKTSQTIDYRTPFESLLHSWKTKGYYDNLIKSIPILKLGEIIRTWMIVIIISIGTILHISPSFQNLNKMAFGSVEKNLQIDGLTLPNTFPPIIKFIPNTIRSL